MDRVQLVKFIRDKFNDSELRDLCFELQIDYESLPGDGKAAKARELVSFCERRDRLPELERTARHMLGVASLLAPGSTVDQRGPLDLKAQDDVPGNSVSSSPQAGAPGSVPSDARARETASLQRQLAEARENLRLVTRQVASLLQQLSEAEENLRLIDERIAQYVQAVDVPLQLIKDQRRLRSGIARLRRQIAELKPIAVLRAATKLISGPVAAAISGEQWDALRQQLLTQASRLPRANYLDVALLNDRTDEMIQLSDEIQVLLMAYRIEPNPGQIEALRQHSGELAADLVRIYRLPPGAAPQLEALASGA
jgi:hypothetical protein